METLKVLKRLYRDGKITRQQYKTYKGQIIAGDVNGCVTGMSRKGLIERK